MARRFLGRFECIKRSSHSRFQPSRLKRSQVGHSFVNPPLAGKVIVVIGGTSGLGLSASRAILAAEGRLIAVGVDQESCDAAAREFTDAAVVLGDARETTCSESAIRIAVERHGRLDGLYHVAGGSGRRFGDGPIHEMTDDGWAATIALNLNSVAFSNRAAIRRFRAQGSGGSIVNLASVLAFSPSPHHFSTHAYAAAKAGIIGLSRSLAAYYASDDIRVNVICPGLVDTPMARRAAHDGSIQKFIRTKQPLDHGRMGKPSDLDAAVIFLLGESGRYCTGQVLAVDRGWSVSEGQIAP